MPDQHGFPTASDVVKHMNERFEARGIDCRIEHIAVLPYVNPMWMANWDIPQIAGLVDETILEEELREARWIFPQVLEDYS